jgi:hypothetical protein
VKKLILCSVLLLSCAPAMTDTRQRIMQRIPNAVEMPTRGIIASTTLTNEWVHVSEGLPMPRQKVVVYSRSQKIVSFASWEYHGTLNGVPFYDWDVDAAELCNKPCPVFVSHWLQLPQPPL